MKLNLLKPICTVNKLENINFSSQDETIDSLFDGVDRKTIDFRPVFDLATELMTYLGVACADLSSTFSTRQLTIM